jgi:hypothetical protein
VSSLVYVRYVQEQRMKFQLENEDLKGKVSALSYLRCLLSVRSPSSFCKHLFVVVCNPTRTIALRLPLSATHSEDRLLSALAF